MREMKPGDPMPKIRTAEETLEWILQLMDDRCNKVGSELADKITELKELEAKKLGLWESVQIVRRELNALKSANKG